jgi:hypothetical protein
MLPALENATISQLDGADSRATVDAIMALQRFGSARAEPALWRALERWHQRFAGKPTDAEEHSLDDRLEWFLRSALTGGTGWLFREASVSRLISLCITDDCREEAENLLSRAVRAPTIRVHGPALPRGEPRFLVESATWGMCESRDALRRWLLLHPPGTRFIWGPPMSSFQWFRGSLWFPGEADAYFEEVRTFLEGHAMSLVQEK